MKTKTTILAASLVCVAGFASLAYAGTGQHEILNPEVVGATAVSDLPTTCYLEADDVTNQRSIFIDCDDVFGLGDSNITLSGTSATLTKADHDGKNIYVSAASQNQAITLPDGGTASGAEFTIFFASSGAPAGDYAVTIAVPSGDNSSFTGSVFMANEGNSSGDGGALLYASSATLGGTDTLTFNSANTEPGDFIVITSAQDTSFALSGSVRFESVGEDSVLIFSSAVTSTD